MQGIRRISGLSFGPQPSGSPALIAPGHDPSKPDILEALEQILKSKLFTSSRHVRFLKYIVEHALQDGTTRMKEYVLATEVFDRQRSFDPHVDPIVRVEASRLRSKLRTYYNTEGREDPIIIELPKGTYVPTFHERVNPPKTRAAHSVWRWCLTSLLIIILVSSLIAILSLVTSHSSRGDTFVAGPLKWSDSIAVLPFTAAADQKYSEHFSEGLTDELINVLAELRSLRVVSRTSVFQFKGVALDVREIARRLNVRTVLEGSVREADNRVRVTAQLIDARSGYQLWSNVYDCKTDDVIQTQMEISQTIATSLRVEPNHGHSSTSCNTVH